MLFALVLLMPLLGIQARRLAAGPEIVGVPGRVIGMGVAGLALTAILAMMWILRKPRARPRR